MCCADYGGLGGLSLGYQWCVRGMWALPINGISVWYACGRCLVCLVNRGVSMVFVLCVHGVLVGGLSVVCFWYRRGVCRDVTPAYGVYAHNLCCLCSVH